MRKISAFGLVILFCVAASAAGPDTEAHAPSQVAADLMREAAGAEVAFLPAGLIKQKFDSNDLSTLVRYPKDEIAVLSLTGAQIRKALERSVALYPSPSDSFLQLSNMEVTFRKKGEPDSRIISVTLGKAPLDDKRTYSVAVPTTLARGGLGYYKVWDKSNIKTTLEKVTLEVILSGKASKESASRWKVRD